MKKIFFLLPILIITAGCTQTNTRATIIQLTTEVNQLNAKIKALTQQVDQLEKDQVNVVESSPGQISDLENWQKYTNSVLGYSIKYPSDWKLFDESDNSIYNSIRIEPTNSEPFIPYLSIIKSSPQLSTIEEIKERNRRLEREATLSKPVWTETLVKMNCYDVYKITTSDSVPGYVEFFFPRNTDPFSIYANLGQAKIQNILDTFRLSN